MTTPTASTTRATLASPREDALVTIQRNPGASEAGVRSYLRTAHGDSSALDTLLASGTVERRGHQLYAASGCLLGAEARHRAAAILDDVDPEAARRRRAQAAAVLWGLLGDGDRLLSGSRVTAGEATLCVSLVSMSGELDRAVEFGRAAMRALVDAGFPVAAAGAPIPEDGCHYLVYLTVPCGGLEA